MKQNTKGFTLIELLAVIVILAIIALIATPIVLNLIDKARMGAAESSAYAYVNAVEKAAVVALMDNSGLNLSGAICTVTGSGKTLNCVKDTVTTPLTIEVKGKLPENDGTITLDSNGSITAANFVINGYSVTVDASGNAKATAKS